MKKLIYITALLGTLTTGSQLSGTPFTGVTAGSPLLTPQVELSNEIVIVEEIIEETFEDSVIETIVELTPEEVVLPEVSEAVEVVTEEQKTVEETIEEELTYDQIHQKDVGEEEVVPEEILKNWYIAEAVEEGLRLILETYELDAYSFVIESTPSNFVYQYDFYRDSADSEHANLVHVFQYDATGKTIFYLDLLTGQWH